MTRSKLLVVVMMVALSTLGCNKRNKADYKKTNAPVVPPTTVTGSRELVRNFEFGSYITPKLQSVYGITASTTCVQWVKVTSGSSVKNIALMADIPCPTSGILSNSAALPLAFNIELNATSDEGYIVDADSGSRVAKIYKSSATSWNILEFCTDTLEAVTADPVQDDTKAGPYFGCELYTEDGNLMNINYYYH